MDIGFWVNALSGLALLAANARGMLSTPLFYAKIVCIVGGVLVMRLLRRTVFNARLPISEVPSPAARKLGVASLACWGLAIVTGRLTAYPYVIEYYFGI